MNDRQRFRVWDKENNKWLHFDFSTYPTYAERIWTAITDGETIYQSTGLKDYSRNLIYEGDIVASIEYCRGNYYTCYSVIKYVNGHYELAGSYTTKASNVITVSYNLESYIEEDDYCDLIIAGCVKNRPSDFPEEVACE